MKFLLFSDALLFSKQSADLHY